jgi:hypothetical protein
MSERVVVTRPIVGFCHMQVCAVNDASDEEVLGAANSQNPSGTTAGWTRIVRSPEDAFGATNCGPVPCADSPGGRTHYMLVC